MKAFITGGGGFVGSAIVRQLVGKGFEVAVFGRNHYSHLDTLGVRQFQGDILDSDLLIHHMRGYDTVFHVAAKAGITSTPSVVFNRMDINGGNETLPYAQRFLCYYASSKAIAEQMVLASNSEILKTCAIRPHLVWGPGDPHLIPRLIARGKAKKIKQVGNGRNMVDISYIDNVADAHILAAENLHSVATAAGKAYFISQGEPVSLWGWINDLFKRLEIAPVTKRINARSAYVAGALLEGIYIWFGLGKEPPMTRFLAEQLAKSHWFSIDRARKDLGYTPRVSTSEGMERLITWLSRR